MLTVYIPDNFIPERIYIINTLLHHYAGYPVNIIARKGQIHYEISWEDKSIVIHDSFFGQTYIGESYLYPERIPETIIETTLSGFENILLFYGKEQIAITDSKIISEVDLFAGAFFMLTRWEESFGLYEDLHGRFPADKALIVKEGFILRPVVDEYVSLLVKWIFSLGYQTPKATSTFKVVPTCDVDIPYYWSSRPLWRILAGRYLKHKSFKKLRQDFHIWRSMKQVNHNDPYDTFAYLMQLAENKNLRFQFNMIPGGETSFEGYYEINDPRILSLMNDFKKRGHDIGLHPSYNAFNDGLKIDAERRMLEKASGLHIKASRQHYLRFAVPETWKHLHNAYLKEDSTLGYAAEPGFRCGTCKPYPVFDVHQRKQLPLIERPLVIMDVSLKFYKQFSIEQSKTYCQPIIDQVKKHNGELVILWHNSSLSELDEWTGWNEVLEFLMDA